MFIGGHRGRKQSISFLLTLSKESKDVTVNSAPVEARVSIDGIDHGLTPLSVQQLSTLLSRTFRPPG